MSNFLKLIAWVMLLLCSNAIYADNGTNTRLLTIDEVFNLAENNSASLKSSKVAAEVAEASISNAKAELLPDINASLSLSYLGNGHLWDRDFKNGMSIGMPHFGNNFAIKASQAIYTGGALSSKVKLSRQGHQMATHQVENTRNSMRFMLIGYYLQLAMLENRINVYDANIKLTESVLSQMQVRYKEGVVLKNDITRYELQLESQKLQRERIADNRKIINHRLATAIGLPADTKIVPDTTIISRLPKTHGEAEWQNLALLNSPTLKMSTLNIGMKQTEERLAKSELLPKVALFAENHLDGPITIEVPTLNNNFNYWLVGVSISYNISSLFKSNKKIRQAYISTRKAQQDLTLAQEQVENNVQAAYTNFLTSFTDLNTQTKSVELANQNYDVVSNRYHNGLALITDMTDAATMKLQSELALVDSRINVIYCYYSLKFAAGKI
ncbi:MAG: TolC family protein [Muribaculaceae bacterium]|nr:TolC family protein [Muribaculaceae bacterium]